MDSVDFNAIVVGAIGVLAGMFAWLGQREARRARKAGEVTAERVASAPGDVGELVDDLASQMLRYDATNTEAHSQLLDHLERLQTHLARTESQVEDLGVELRDHMREELGPGGALPKVTEALNGLRLQMLEVAEKVQSTYSFMNGYDGSALPDSEAVNALVEKVDRVDEGLSLVDEKIRRLEGDG
jgi:hypothetical protein